MVFRGASKAGCGGGMMVEMTLITLEASAPLSLKLNSIKLIKLNSQGKQTLSL